MMLRRAVIGRSTLKRGLFAHRILPMVCGVAVVVAGASILLPSSLRSAAGATPACWEPRDGDDDYGQVQAQERGGSYGDLSGVRSRIYIVSSGHCQRVFSVYVFAPTGGALMEFGYVRGWSNCTGPDNTWTYFSQPTPFAFFERPNGTWDCYNYASHNPPVGGTATFQVSDANHNSYWGSYYNGIELNPNGIFLDFTGGRGGINMERASSEDSGYAHFTNVAEHHSQWSLFEAMTQVWDHDPNWRLRIPNGHEGEIVP